MMLAQHIANILIIAAGYLLIALSFSIVFRVAKFLNVSHAVPYVAGPYAALTILKWCGMPLIMAFLFGLVVAGGIGAALNYAVFRPLRLRQASSLVQLMASLGVYVVFQNFISLVFSDDTLPLREGIIAQGINVLGARITQPQIAILCAAILIILGAIAVSRMSKIGVVYRAVAADAELANLSGITSESVIFWAFILGSGLAGLAGILISNDINMEPGMGLQVVLMGVIVVVIAGRESVVGLVPSALFISAAQTVGVWQISSRWQNALAFAILLLFLIVRPQGFFGRPVSKVSV